MSLLIRLDPEAKDEYDEAYDWHEGQRAGRGDAFTEAVQEVIDRISVMPRVHATVFGDVRKAVVQGFSYCVYYREESSRVRILAVFHTSRDPSIWQKRASQ